MVYDFVRSLSTDPSLSHFEVLRGALGIPDLGGQ